MQFQIPQYIEHEAKVVGPLTFKQFIYVGSAGVVSFFLYFTASFSLFAMGSAIVWLLALAFAFAKVGGRSLMAFIKNFLFYLIKPKIYLWKKKETALGIKIVKEEKKEKQKTDTTGLKIAEKSRLKELATKVETKQR